MDICGCSDPITNGKSQNLKDLKVSNAIFTRDLYASGNVTAARFYGDGGLLSNITSGGFTQPLANLVVSNSVTTTNIIASGNVSASYFVGDGGLLSNITSGGFTQPLANLVVSNSVTTTNIYASGEIRVDGEAHLGDLYSAGGIDVGGVATFHSSLGVEGDLATNSNFTVSGNTNLANLYVSNSVTAGNIYSANALTTTNVFATRANVITINVTSLQTGSLAVSNLYSANALTTTNVFATRANIAFMNVASNLTVAGAFTSNVSNTTFFYDTLTIPYINTLTMNSAAVTTGTLIATGITSFANIIVSNLQVTNTFIITATNVQSTNAISITNQGTMTALYVNQNEFPNMTYNVAEFWDHTQLAMVVDGYGNVAVHTGSSPGYAFTVVDGAKIDRLTVTENMYGVLAGSNAVSASSVSATTLYGTIAGSNAVSASSVSATTLYGTIAGSNVVSASTLYGTIAGSNAVSASSVSATTLYGTIAGSNVVSASTLYGTLAGSNIVSSTLILGNTLSNIQSSNITQPFANLVVSNSVTTTNVFVSKVINIGPSGTLQLGGSALNFGQTSKNKIITLFDMNNTDNQTTATNFFGFGTNMSKNTLLYQGANNNAIHSISGGTQEYANFSAGGLSILCSGSSSREALDVTGNADISGTLALGGVSEGYQLNVLGSGTAIFDSGSHLVYINTNNTNHNYFKTVDGSASHSFNMAVYDGGSGDASTNPNTMVNFSRLENNNDGNFHLEFVNISQNGGSHNDYGVGFGFYDTAAGTGTTVRSPFVINTHSPAPLGSFGNSTDTGDTALSIQMDGTKFIGINIEPDIPTLAQLDVRTYNNSIGSYTFQVSDNGNPIALSTANAMTVLTRTEYNDIGGTPEFHLELINRGPDRTYGVAFGFLTQNDQPGQNNDQKPFIISVHSQGSFSDTTTIPPAITIFTDGTQYVGINTESPGSQLDVNGDINARGALYAFSKPFLIPHPFLPVPNKLIHNAIEGPRCDLIYRGKSQLINGQSNVNIDIDSTTHPMTQGTFVSLCTNPQYFLQNGDSFDRVKGKIIGNILTITCENSNSNDEINWMIIAERHDESIKSWNKTDSNGFLIPEHAS